MWPPPSRNVWVLLAAVSALVAPACGGGGGGGGGAETADAGATTETTADRPVTAASGDAETFCAEARRLKDEGPSVAGGDARRMLAERFTAMAKAAPEAIKPDVEVIAAMWVDAEKNDVTPSIGGPDAAASIKPYSELMKRHPKVQEAGMRFSAFVAEECGFFY